MGVKDTCLILSETISTKLYCYIEIAELQKSVVCVILNIIDNGKDTILMRECTLTCRYNYNKIKEVSILKRKFRRTENGL